MKTKVLFISLFLFALIFSGCGGKAVLLINCGADEDLEDCGGNIWKKDQPFEESQWGYVDGSTVLRGTVEVENSDCDMVYLNERYSMEAYRIPLENGEYTLKLHFAETYQGITDVGERVFSVKVEGKEVLKDFDAYKEAGSKSFAAVVKEFKVNVADGELTIEFIENIQNPMINGIEILK